MPASICWRRWPSACWPAFCWVGCWAFPGRAAAGSARAPAAATLTPLRLLGLAGVLVVWATGAGLYFFAGQPGLHGDELFVVMRDQADVSSAASIPDRVQRLT